MIGATFCSGIGAPEIACPEIDWRLASEIERFPRAVLSHRYGVVPAHLTAAQAAGHYLWGDMTALRVRHMRRLGIPFPNVIVAGTPCQAFSIAGARQSLDDARGNLTLQFVRMVHAIRKAARDANGRSILRWLLWENVPGVLSTKDNAFGCFLSGLVGADDPLCTPDGARWPDAGMVAGPWARAAWRILDAQYFELAQRRRRVFVVVGFGDDCDPAAVLFERLGLHGNHAPGRETRQDVTGTLSARSHGGGGLGTDLELGGGLQVSHCLNAGGMGRQDAESETLIPILQGGSFDDLAMTLSASRGRAAAHDASLETYVTHTLRGEGFDASEDGTGRGVPLVPVAMNLRGRAGGSLPELDDVASPRAGDGGSSRSYIAFDAAQITSPHNRSECLPDAPCPPLHTFGEPHSIAFAIQERAISENLEAGPQGSGLQEDLAFTLEARHRPQSVAIPINMQVAQRHKAMGERTGLGVGADGDPANTLSKAHHHAAMTGGGRPQAHGSRMRAAARIPRRSYTDPRLRRRGIPRRYRSCGNGEISRLRVDRRSTGFRSASRRPAIQSLWQFDGAQSAALVIAADCSRRSRGGT